MFAQSVTALSPHNLHLLVTGNMVLKVTVAAEYHKQKWLPPKRHGSFLSYEQESRTSLFIGQASRMKLEIQCDANIEATAARERGRG
ncbi:hypothetical protein MPTK1_5g18900 [Marchantia polymorpha subsp. ruderalis]|uniref:Uncharacterized protein n=2 Tax=Marchantia polymorpha TaxID=3197 RepID=A0AAF6BJW4_MARPO|nr:hypothetical protein MARPO_0073s0052 [Marchantia polymorpha]BBN12298.1 hypothetical protein Mp_5g18900 [Marchantia polymorpha subsp. ruderalis]|eukprot:PTQ35178.1 hypothetical protein MARPO_0073s0052 [Marchantia polymorpha]